jgi:hypothetical protein
MEGRPDGTMRIMSSPCAPGCHLDRRPALSPLVISTGGSHFPLLVISTGGRRPVSCHFDRRSAQRTGAEKSGCELGVSRARVQVHRPDGESFRPKDRFGNGATSRRSQMSRLRSAPKDIGFAGDKGNSRKYRADKELSRSNPHGPCPSRHEPRSGLATRHDRAQGVFPNAHDRRTVRTRPNIPVFQYSNVPPGSGVTQE